MSNRIDMDKVSEYFQNIHGNITLGVDGYIDEVWQVLDSRNSLEDYAVCQKMKSFGERIVSRGEGGITMEIVSKRRGYGGFTGNTSRAVSSLGLKPTVIGMYGKGAINPVFAEMESACRLISIGEPAVSHIFEFEDGKVMLPYIQSILEFNWDLLTDALGGQALYDIFGGSDIFALGYWSSMHAFDELVGNLCNEAKNKPKKMFYDFGDITKRDQDALRKTISMLGGLNGSVPMALSLNEHEAEALYACFGDHFPQDGNTAEKSIGAMRGRIGISELIVHTPYFAVMSSAEEGSAAVKQIHCEKPVKTTGAGDTFNGGYIAADLGGLNAYERLAAANAATGYFVKTGACADRARLLEEMRILHAQL